MEELIRDVAPPSVEVPMVDPEEVRQITQLASQGWGVKRIARALGLARNTVRRYVRGAPAGVQMRPGARRLDDAARARAVALFESAAAGNAVVAASMLADEGGASVSVRTVQRAVAGRRRAARAAQLATVRYETAPGHQMQIDFGQKRVMIGGAVVVVHLLVAVLGFSRRCFVRAFLTEIGDDWREGIAAAFRHFGGVPRELLGDNARALVQHHDPVAQTVVYHPSYVAFCKDWGVVPRTCRPYRARTKGKTESGVKYVKHNALAGRAFEDFAALEAHLARWMVAADARVHGTTHEAPAARFARAEAAALRPLPARPPPARVQRLSRRVANDAFVDVATVRYSVPHRLVRDRVEVALGVAEVKIFHGALLVATHARSFEPYARVVDAAHYEGLWRPASAPSAPAQGAAALAALGRDLSEYAAVVAGGGR